MIAYKVVDKKTRKGSNFVLIAHNFNDTPEETEKLSNKKGHKQYFPYYLKGKRVYKARNSVGIICFTYKSDAENFREMYSALKEYSIIIKVETGTLLPEGNIFCRCGNSIVYIGQRIKNKTKSERYTHGIYSPDSIEKNFGKVFFCASVLVLE